MTVATFTGRRRVAWVCWLVIGGLVIGQTSTNAFGWKDRGAHGKRTSQALRHKARMNTAVFTRSKAGIRRGLHAPRFQTRHSSRFKARRSSATRTRPRVAKPDPVQKRIIEQTRAANAARARGARPTHLMSTRQMWKVVREVLGDGRNVSPRAAKRVLAEMARDRHGLPGDLKAMLKKKAAGAGAKPTGADRAKEKVMAKAIARGQAKLAPTIIDVETRLAQVVGEQHMALHGDALFERSRDPRDLVGKQRREYYRLDRQKKGLHAEHAKSASPAKVLAALRGDRPMTDGFSYMGMFGLAVVAWPKVLAADTYGAITINPRNRLTGKRGKPGFDYQLFSLDCPWLSYKQWIAKDKRGKLGLRRGVSASGIPNTYVLHDQVLGDNIGIRVPGLVIIGALRRPDGQSAIEVGIYPHLFGPVKLYTNQLVQHPWLEKPVDWAVGTFSNFLQKSTDMMVAPRRKVVKPLGRRAARLTDKVLGTRLSQRRFDLVEAINNTTGAVLKLGGEKAMNPGAITKDLVKSIEHSTQFAPPLLKSRPSKRPVAKWVGDRKTGELRRVFRTRTVDPAKLSIARRAPFNGITPGKEREGVGSILVPDRATGIGPHFVAQARRALTPGGLLVWDGASTAQVDRAKRAGFELIDGKASGDRFYRAVLRKPEAPTATAAK